MSITQSANQSARQAHIDRAHMFAISCCVHLLDNNVTMAKHCANLAKQSQLAADAYLED